MQLGEWNIEGKGGLLDTIPWWQFQRWIEFRNRYGPFGEERADQRIGVAAARMTVILAASQGHKVKLKPSDFMLDYIPKESTGPTREGWLAFKSSLKAYGQSLAKNKAK